MRTILALSLITAAFATMMPAASAECVETLCVDSYGYGTCDNGYASNSAYYYSYDGGYTYAGASTSCAGYPGYYEGTGISAGATFCDAGWSCDYAGVGWYSYDFGWGSYCGSEAYAYVDGQWVAQPLPLCDVAGAPPAVPALLP